MCSSELNEKNNSMQVRGHSKSMENSLLAALAAPAYPTENCGPKARWQTSETAELKR
jgi:hypothetical protein